MRKVALYSLSSLILLAFSCHNSEPTLAIMQTESNSIKVGEVECILLVTDLQGKPQTVFKQGENFLLSFTIKNHSDQEVRVCEGSLLSKIVPELFTVYQELNEGKFPIGKPYESISTSCRFIAPSILSANTENNITLPWLWGNGENKQAIYDTPNFGYYLNPDDSLCKTLAIYSAQAPRTSKLAVGNYFTQLSTTLYNREIQLRYDFIVE